MSSQHITALTLEEWAGSQNLNLTLVFTDIVDSTLIGKKLGSEMDRRFVYPLLSSTIVNRFRRLLRREGNRGFIDDGLPHFN
jgi:hypothetical protein